MSDWGIMPSSAEEPVQGCFSSQAQQGGPVVVGSGYREGERPVRRRQRVMMAPRGGLGPLATDDGHSTVHTLPVLSLSQLSAPARTA
jgi:hypothetical protein